MRSLAASVTAALLLLTATAQAADRRVIHLWQTETESQTIHFAVADKVMGMYRSWDIDTG